MIDLQAIITDVVLLQQRVIFREGFAFTSLANIGNPANVFDAIVIRDPVDAPCFTPKLPSSSKSLQEHIDFINYHNLEKAVIIARDISFICKCPTLKYLQIIPSDNANIFNFSPLYDMPSIHGLHCATQYGLHLSQNTSIDYANFRNIYDLDIHGTGHLNTRQLTTVRRLNISRNPSYYLSDVISGATVETLSLTQCGFKSMTGIKDFVNLTDLSLWYNRRLGDVSEITQCAKTLKSLSIDTCPKIQDFSFLKELHNLEFLELKGSNKLQNLDFLPQMRKLKYFIFSMNVVNGDLSNCLSIPYVYSQRNRKHYNLLDRDLPKKML